VPPRVAPVCDQCWDPGKSHFEVRPSNSTATSILRSCGAGPQPARQFDSELNAFLHLIFAATATATANKARTWRTALKANGQNRMAAQRFR